MPRNIETLPPPSENDVALARTAVAKLAGLPENQAVELQLHGREDIPGVELPASALRVLEIMFRAMAEGNAVTITPTNAELSTIEAADMLSISRPTLIKLLDDKEIDYHMVRTHRRILVADVLRFKEKQKARADAALQELADIAQEEGFGYD